MSARIEIGEVKTRAIEVTTVQDMLVATRGNQTYVAELLDINRCTLHKMIKSKADNAVLIKKDEVRRNLL